jgi:hypothetical protein
MKSKNKRQPQQRVRLEQEQESVVMTPPRCKVLNTMTVMVTLGPRILQANLFGAFA